MQLVLLVTLFHSLCLSIMLPNFEISIVSTSLVAITNDLEGLSQSSWIVIAYLLTYSSRVPDVAVQQLVLRAATGFLVIWAKLSDIFGRKLSIITAVAIFTLFSGGCGAAQATTQLWVSRRVRLAQW